MEFFFHAIPQGYEGVIPALRPPCTFEKYDPYPDFADGVSEAFVVSGLAEGYGIELSFVEVGHGALPLLLTERFGGFQGVLKRTTVKRERRAISERPDLHINRTLYAYQQTFSALQTKHAI